MESALLSEKVRNKKLISQKSSRIRDLESELEEIRTENRTLEIRVRALNNELSTYKKGRIGRYSNPIPRKPISSRESSRDRNSRNASADRRVGRPSARPPSYSKQSALSSR